MSKAILICTVGGSPEPICISIRENKPDEVVFICSEKDRITGMPGSCNQIEGDTSSIKEQLDNTPYSIKEVPADNLEEAVGVIRKCLQQLIEKHPDATIIADYTGGTKTMSVALVLVATDDKKNVKLGLVTGPRKDQVKITKGSGVSRVDTEGIRISRVIKQSTRYWKYFAYAEAAKMLADIKPNNARLAEKVRMLENLGKAFDAWDRFDHPEGAKLLGLYRGWIASDHESLLTSIDKLTREQTHPVVVPARLWDLWFNALRRAEQGRFDDAVARVYRLIEWTAQWILQTRCQIDTSNIDCQKIPGNISIQANKKGQYKAGLMTAWELIGHHLPDSEVGRFGKEKLEALQHQISLRNHSILAHGYSPIGEKDWETFKKWMGDNFRELLKQETKKAGLRSIPGQLPQQPGPKISRFLQEEPGITL